MIEMASLIGIIIVIVMTLVVVATFGGLVYLLLYLVNKHKNNKE